MQGERKDEEENGWLKVQAVPVTELDLEPQDYDLDISREVRAGASFILLQEAQPSGSQPDPPSSGHWGVLSSSGDKAQLQCGPGDRMDSSLRHKRSLCFNADSSLCNLGQVMCLLCASVSSVVKWVVMRIN